MDELHSMVLGDDRNPICSCDKGHVETGNETERRIETFSEAPKRTSTPKFIGHVNRNMKISPSGIDFANESCFKNQEYSSLDKSEVEKSLKARARIQIVSTMLG